MSNTIDGSNFKGRFLINWLKLKNTCFFDKFLCLNFNCMSLTVIFMVLGAQSMVIFVSFGQGMELSFKMSHEEAL